MFKHSICFGSASKLIQSISSLIFVSSLVLSPSFQAGLLELPSSCLHRLRKILAAVMKAHLSQVLPKVHPLYISNKCPHLCSQQCPSPNSLFSIASRITVFWAAVCSVSQYSLAGWQDIVAWGLISVCSFVWSFIWPYIVYSQVLGDGTFCLIMLQTDWEFSCYSL